MRVGVLSLAVASVIGVCYAQAPDTAQRLVAACTSESAFGMAFGERSDRLFAQAPDLSPHRAGVSLRRTPNSRQLHLAEIIVELPDAASARAFLAAVQTAAAASGRFPQRASIEDGETTTMTAADASVRLELGVIGRGAYITCVKPQLQQLALDEALGRVRVAERPAAPSLPLPPRPAAGICQDTEARRRFVADFESALQSPMEYAAGLGAYSNTLQQWYGQQLKDRSDFSDADDANLAMRTLQDPVFSTELDASMRHLSAFMTGLIAFADAREAGDEPLACSQALDTLSRIDEMSASSQRQWARIEALYREEAARRGVTLD